MKKIIVSFLTDKGEEAYQQSLIAEKKETWTNKAIMSKIIHPEVIVSKKPLIVETSIKISWLAVQVKLDDLIIQGLEKLGAKNNKDFKIKIEW